VYAYAPNALTANATAKRTTAALENSLITGTVIPLPVGTQIASMAAPLDMGVYESVDEV
jgi:hypothetical protein